MASRMQHKAAAANPAVFCCKRPCGQQVRWRTALLTGGQRDETVRLVHRHKGFQVCVWAGGGRGGVYVRAEKEAYSQLHPG